MTTSLISFELLPKNPKIEKLLNGVLNGEKLTRSDALFLLKAKHPKDIFSLFHKNGEELK